MKGVQVSFRDIMPQEEYNDIFAGPGALLKGMKNFILASTSKALKEYKSDLKTSVLLNFLEKLNLQNREVTQLSKKYESQAKEVLLQTLNNKKLKSSVYSKVDYIELFRKYNINSLSDFDNILSDEGFKFELNEIIHKIIIEELSLAIERTDYYKECIRYQNIIVQRIKSFSMRLHKYITVFFKSDTGKQLRSVIIEKIIESIMKYRAGNSALYIFYKSE